MGQSTIPAFRRGLRDRIAADATFLSLGAQLAVGHPYPQRIDQDFTLILGTKLQEPPYLMAGAGQYVKAEDYDTQLLCVASGHNREDQLGMEEAAWAISEAVCDSIRAWAADGPWTGITTPSGSYINWITVTDRELTQAIDDNVREAQVAVTIHTRATI